MILLLGFLLTLGITILIYTVSYVFVEYVVGPLIERKEG